MNYWWVYQGKSFERARKGGYLWAPETTKSGGTPYYYWTNVTRVDVSDLIFSHVDGQIVAVCTPLRLPYRAPAPDKRDTGWAATGFRVDVEYRMLEAPVAFDVARDAINDLGKGAESPFARDGRPNQGYLFRLSDRAGVRLSELACSDTDLQPLTQSQTQAPGERAPANTSVQSTVLVRLGQSVFRRRLDLYWRERCAVTGLNIRDLLRASHIKRWSDADDRERLDRFNGLLLSAAYDAAFDRGLISFQDDGAIILSKAMSGECCRLAGIDPVARISELEAPHRTYLAYHRENYFLR